MFHPSLGQFAPTIASASVTAAEVAQGQDWRVVAVNGMLTVLVVVLNAYFVRRNEARKPSRKRRNSAPAAKPSEAAAARGSESSSAA